jgi:hypothetical protein
MARRHSVPIAVVGSALALASSSVAARHGLLPPQLPQSTGGAFYVSPSGSDTNPGTSTRPWRSLQRAFDNVGPGQTVFLKGGTYPDWAELSSNGTPTAPITVRSAAGEQATLTGRLKLTGSYLAASNLRFVGGTSANNRDVLLYVAGARHVEIAHDKFTGGTMSAIYVGDPGHPSRDVQIIANRIWRNGSHWNLDHGIYFGTGTGGLIANNIITGNKAYGIQLYPQAVSVIVASNTIVGNGRSGIILGGEATTSSHNVIANNIIADNSEYGVRSYWGGSVGTDNVAVNNLSYGNKAGSPSVGLLAGIRVESPVSADPLFKAAEQLDFHLRAGSPAIGRALPSYTEPTDLEDLPRPARASLGALEYR